MPAAVLDYYENNSLPDINGNRYMSSEICSRAIVLIFIVICGICSVCLCVCGLFRKLNQEDQED
jgi:hypothetical protein